MRAVLGLGVLFTKVYIDISSCRPIAEVMDMAAAHASGLRLGAIVIKNTPLERFVQRCVVWPGTG